MLWHKGLFAGFAPIWVMDPERDCIVHPRGILGHILLPVAETISCFSIMVLTYLDDDYDPRFVVLINETPADPQPDLKRP